MSNEDHRCMLGAGFGWGVSAYATHYEDGRITLTIGDDHYEEEVNYCPKCGGKNE